MLSIGLFANQTWQKRFVHCKAKRDHKTSCVKGQNENPMQRRLSLNGQYGIKPLTSVLVALQFNQISEPAHNKKLSQNQRMNERPLYSQSNALPADLFFVR